jgi:hypothetical protein
VRSRAHAQLGGGSIALTRSANARNAGSDGGCSRNSVLDSVVQPFARFRRREPNQVSRFRRREPNQVSRFRRREPNQVSESLSGELLERESRTRFRKSQSQASRTRFRKSQSQASRTRFRKARIQWESASRARFRRAVLRRAVLMLQASAEASATIPSVASVGYGEPHRSRTRFSRSRTRFRRAAGEQRAAEIRFRRAAAEPGEPGSGEPNQESRSRTRFRRAEPFSGEPF